MFANKIILLSNLFTFALKQKKSVYTININQSL